jgi:Xaa-Pro dipeptidase
MMIKSRIQRIFSYCNPAPEAIIIKNGSEPSLDKMFFYATGLMDGLFEGCAAVLFPDGSFHLIVSSLEADIAQKVTSNILVYGSSKEFFTHLRTVINKCKNIGISYSSVSHAEALNLAKQFSNVHFQDVSNAFVSARMKKDADEIAYIQKACAIADKVMDSIPELVHNGMTETELASEINYHLQKYGAKSPAFETISSFGANTALPHYSHGEKRLENGDFIVCDFGACYNMYNSDMTRTFVLGSANYQQKRMYETVLTAQQTGIGLVHAGAIAKEVHQQVFDIIEKTEFAGRFIHSTGHSLGIYVHDGGVGFHSQSLLSLEPGMVLTVEPGVYLPGIGGVRIEDDILVEPMGCTVLTRSPRELIEI